MSATQTTTIMTVSQDDERQSGGFEPMDIVPSGHEDMKTNGEESGKTGSAGGWLRSHRNAVFGGSVLALSLAAGAASSYYGLSPTDVLSAGTRSAQSVASSLASLARSWRDIDTQVSVSEGSLSRLSLYDKVGDKCMSVAQTLGPMILAGELVLKKASAVLDGTVKSVGNAETAWKWYCRRRGVIGAK